MKLKNYLLLIAVAVTLIIFGTWYFEEELKVIMSVILGTAIPLIVNLSTFFLVRKMSEKSPENLMRASTTAFTIRLLLYAVIIVFLTQKVDIIFTPFISSFFLIFVFLFVGEAFYFRGLFLKKIDGK
tara:strand:- start:12542 stop:12922 length:381 start_codon:yes stop_codon:yes gene_type:complete